LSEGKKAVKTCSSRENINFSLSAALSEFHNSKQIAISHKLNLGLSALPARSRNFCHHLGGAKSSSSIHYQAAPPPFT